MDGLIKKDRHAHVRVDHLKGEPTPSVTLYFNSPEAVAAAKAGLPEELRETTRTGTSKTSGLPYLTFPIQGKHPASYYEKVIQDVTAEVSGSYRENLARFTPPDPKDPGMVQAVDQFRQWQEQRTQVKAEQQAAVVKSLEELSQATLPKELQKDLRDARDALDHKDSKALFRAKQALQDHLTTAVLDNTLDQATLTGFNRLVHQIETLAPAEGSAPPVAAPQAGRGK